MVWISYVSLKVSVLTQLVQVPSDLEDKNIESNGREDAGLLGRRGCYE